MRTGALSGRSFPRLSGTILFLLFILQTPVVLRYALNTYDQNPFVTETGLRRSDSWTVEADATPRAAFLGDPDSRTAAMVREWAEYRKFRLLLCTDPKELGAQLPDVLILSASFLPEQALTEVLERAVSQDKAVILFGLLKAALLRRSQQVRTLCGVREAGVERVNVRALHLCEGFLLGGEAFYRMEEESMRFPPLLLSQTAETYLTGYTEDGALLPLIWRNGPVFSVYGDFLEGLGGLGLLNAMLARIWDYDLYPVVNAQVLSVTECPVLTERDKQAVLEPYGLSVTAFLRDDVWPQLYTAAWKSGFSLSCFAAPELSDGQDSDRQEEKPSETAQARNGNRPAKLLEEYLRVLCERGGEAGISLRGAGPEKLLTRLSHDAVFFRETEIGYTYNAAFLDSVSACDALAAFSRTAGISASEMENFDSFGKFRTAVCPYDGSRNLLSWLDEDMTLQMAAERADSHNWQDDLRLRSVETALAYSHIVYDIRKTVFPRTPEERWEHYGPSCAGNLDTRWRRFSYFDRTTVSESDRRIRVFLCTDCRHQRRGNIIRLEAMPGASFLLRLRGQRAAEISGGALTELEEGAYLIRADEPLVTLTLCQPCAGDGQAAP